MFLKALVSMKYAASWKSKLIVGFSVGWGLRRVKVCRSRDQYYGMSRYDEFGVVLIRE